MGWNGSGNSKTPDPARSAQGMTNSRIAARRSFKRGVLTGIVVIIGASLAIWLCLPKDDAPTQMPQDNKKHQIQQSEARVKTSAPDRKKWRPNRKVEMTADVTPPARLTKDVVDLGALPTNCLLRKVLFKRNSDNLIAGVITAVPGDHFLTSNHWDPSFDAEFKASLNEKIEFSEEDSEEDRLVKEAVNETRKMLAEQMRKGWKPSEVMGEAQKELEKITAYRDQLDEIMQGYIEKDDLEGALKFKDEANELLKEYNATPLTIAEKKIQKIQSRIKGNEEAL